MLPNGELEAHDSSVWKIQNSTYPSASRTERSRQKLEHKHITDASRRSRTAKITQNADFAVIN